MDEKECIASGGHKWSNPIYILNPPEVRRYCEKCHKLEIKASPVQDKPKRRFFSISWKDWLKSATRTGSVKIQ
jgi:hypothetical protein